MDRRKFLARAAAALGGGILAAGRLESREEQRGPPNSGRLKTEPVKNEPVKNEKGRKIAAVDVFPIQIPFCREFRTSGGLIGSPTMPGPHVYVRIVTDDGSAGWGEGRPARTWSYETLETVVSTSRKYLGPALVGRDPADIPGARAAMDREIAPGSCGVGQPVAKAAMDTALWDLKGKLLGVNVAELWGRKPGDGQVLSFTVCGSSPDAIRAEVEEGLAAGYRNFNCKIGRAYEDDRREIEALRRWTPEGAFLWADANRGYRLPEALRILPVLRDLGFGALEQPLPDHHGHELAELRKASGPVRILVDEALGDVDDLRNFIRLGAIHGVTLKLGRMGGISPNLDVLEIARGAGLDIFLSGLTESGVALVAASALGAAFGVKFPAALNGPQLLAESVLAGGWPVKEGKVVLRPRPGLGVDVDEAALGRLAVKV